MNVCKIVRKLRKENVWSSKPKLISLKNRKNDNKQNLMGESQKKTNKSRKWLSDYSP